MLHHRWAVWHEAGWTGPAAPRYKACCRDHFCLGLFSWRAVLIRRAGPWRCSWGCGCPVAAGNLQVLLRKQWGFRHTFLGGVCQVTDGFLPSSWFYSTAFLGYSLLQCNTQGPFPVVSGPLYFTPVARYWSNGYLSIWLEVFFHLTLNPVLSNLSEVPESKSPMFMSLGLCKHGIKIISFHSPDFSLSFSLMLNKRLKGEDSR